MGEWIEKDQGLRDLWEAICSQPFEETQDLQRDLLERIGQAECNEKVAASRIDRLRGLGNAVVPAIPYEIARLIMLIEKPDLLG